MGFVGAKFYCLHALADVVSVSQVIGCEDRLRNDLYCVKWGVKLYSNQPTNLADGSQCNRTREMMMECSSPLLQILRTVALFFFFRTAQIPPTVTNTFDRIRFNFLVFFRFFSFWCCAVD